MGFGVLMARLVPLAVVVSCAKASQKALWVMKLSLLFHH